MPAGGGGGDGDAVAAAGHHARRIVQRTETVLARGRLVAVILGRRIVATNASSDSS